MVMLVGGRLPEDACCEWPKVAAILKLKLVRKYGRKSQKMGGNARVDLDGLNLVGLKTCHVVRFGLSGGCRCEIYIEYI